MTNTADEIERPVAPSRQAGHAAAMYVVGDDGLYYFTGSAPLTGEGPPPHDAATATGMYDRGDAPG